MSIKDRDYYWLRHDALSRPKPTFAARFRRFLHWAFSRQH